MPDTVRIALALLLAGGVTLALTPLAMRLARATSFYDHPVGYKGHERATPYLGGIALVAGFLSSSCIFGWGEKSLLPMSVGALVLLVLGTVDDRRNLGPIVRLLVEIAAAAGLFAAGIGWSIFSSDAPNLILTVVFVAGVVNAYNLMDNMDGAATSVAASSAIVLGIAAVLESNPRLGAIAFAIAGGSLAFLRFNLADPARIFLGDGGSMPVGFALATTVMALPSAGSSNWSFVLVAVVLVGLPALDTTLVVVSRVRRAVGVFTGGRDHLTHRLRAKLSSARWVAAALAATQVCLVGLGVALLGLDSEAVRAACAAALILLGVAVVALMETPAWAPATAEWSA